MPTDHELELIATFEMALGISKNVKGMEGFVDYFIKRRPFNDRRLIHRYLATKEAIREDFLKQAEQDGWTIPAPNKPTGN